MWLAGVIVTVVVLNVLGVDVRGWMGELWDSMNDISLRYVLAGSLLQVGQTAFVALAWCSILAYAYPEANVAYRTVLACYAVGVALNNVLPANLGTFVMLLMFLAVVRNSTFPGVLAAYLVHKIFYTVVGGLVYLYLFLSVPGSIDASLGGVDEHPVLVLGILAGAVVLVILLGRILWQKIKGLWAKARDGGRILSEPAVYAKRVLVPQTAGYVAKLGVICVFLAAYSIPVTVDSVISVVGSSSIANTVSVTPGGVGVTQAANIVALQDYADAETATAYSISQQLITTIINMGFALVLVVWVFGWTGGRQLVGESYVGAKSKAAEMSEERKTKRQAKKDAKHVVSGADVSLVRHDDDPPDGE